MIFPSPPPPLFHSCRSVGMARGGEGRERNGPRIGSSLASSSHTHADTRTTDGGTHGTHKLGIAYERERERWKGKIRWIGISLEALQGPPIAPFLLWRSLQDRVNPTDRRPRPWSWKVTAAMADGRFERTNTSVQTSPGATGRGSGAELS